MSLQKVAQQYQQAQSVIAVFLAELRGNKVVTHTDYQNASAIIARLANAKPPLLICEAGEIKD